MTRAVKDREKSECKCVQTITQLLLEFYTVVHTPEFPLAFSLQVIKTKLTGSHLHHFLIHIEHNQEKGKI